MAIMELQKEFETQIPQGDLDKCERVQDVVDYLEGKVNG